MNRRSILALAVSLGLAGLLVFAFVQGRAEFAKEKQREAPVKAPSRVSTAMGAAVVTLDPATQARADLAVTALESAHGPIEDQAYATVLAAQDLGDARSNYARSKAQLDQALARQALARKDHERLKVLHDDDRNVSDKALQLGAAALASEEANVRAAQVVLQDQAAGVAQRYGAQVARWLTSDAPPLQRLVRQQDVLIQVALAPGAGSAPKKIRVQTGDQGAREATLLGRSPRVDPRVQGAAYLYVAAGDALVPGMNVQAALPRAEAAHGVVVPQSALVWWQGRPWAYVQRSPGQFVRVEVPTGMPVAAGFVAQAGFKPAEPVVTRGAQLLLSEEFRAQIQVGDEGQGQ